MISDHRLLADDGQTVTFRIKDYKAGDVKEFSLVGDEVSRRWAMHILPKHLARVRYGGIFAAGGRQDRLATCRKLIGELKAHPAEPDALGAVGSLPTLEMEGEYIDDEPPLPKCHCRYCQGDMELLGRLQGTETQAMRSLAQSVIYRTITTLLPVIGDCHLKELLVQLRGAWLVRRWLPACIRDLFVGKRLSSLECGVLEAFVVGRAAHTH